MAAPTETVFALRELVKEIDRLRQDTEKLINERFGTLAKQAEKNESLIRINAESLKSLPSSLDAAVREIMAKEFSPERSLDQARKILDGLRQGMHLFLGGTLSRTKSKKASGIVPASAFPEHPANPYMLAEQAETHEETVSTPDGTVKKRDTTASFSISKDGNVNISVDKSTRAGIAAGIVALISAIGWAVTAIVHAIK